MALTTDAETVWMRNVTTRLLTDEGEVTGPNLPDQFSFHFKRKTHDLVLKLKRNYQSDPNIDIYVVQKLKDCRPLLEKTQNSEKGGHSVPSGVCDVGRRVQIVRVDDFFMNTRNTAHELGHATCLKTKSLQDQNIMGEAIKVLQIKSEQRYTPDEQCIFTNGYGSKYYGVCTDCVMADDKT